MINWLRRQPVLQVDDERKLIMGHAGITPQWDIETAQMCAREVEAVLSSDSYPLFLDAMYGDMPNNWSPELSGLARLRFSTNALTRMRYCFPNGQLDMICKDAPGTIAPLKPWFDLPRLVDRVQHHLRPLGITGRQRHAGRDHRSGYRLLLGRGFDPATLGRQALLYPAKQPP